MSDQRDAGDCWDSTSGVPRAYTFTSDEIVLQPTSFCNLDCSYCYLPEKNTLRRMKPEVANRVAEYVQVSDGSKLLLWHCGEPLAVGLPHFCHLIKPFNKASIKQKTSHLVQTNATLIDQAWCDFFKEYDFQIGVSIDGPAFMNRRRVTRTGKETYKRTLRGIDFLRRNDLTFSIIAVVDSENLQHAEDLYAFARNLGTQMLCVNIEESEGVNESGVTDSKSAKEFWGALYNLWKKEMALPIREFHRQLPIMRRVAASGRDDTKGYYKIELIPSISTHGDVSLLSPEFLGMTKTERCFVAGNVLASPLAVILKSALRQWYVSDYVKGIEACRAECQYFSFCGGGYASNKYFENGDIASTETHFCRNKQKAVVDALLEAIENE